MPQTIVIENRPYDNRVFNRVNVALLSGQEIAVSFGTRRELKAALAKTYPAASFRFTRV